MLTPPQRFTLLGLAVAAAVLTIAGQRAADVRVAPEPPAARVRAVATSVDSIAQRNAETRQRVRVLEMRLLMIERAYRQLDRPQPATPTWSAPVFAGAVPRAAAALVLPIDVPNDLPLATPATAAAVEPAPPEPLPPEAAALDTSLAVDDSALSEMRGGFLTTNGLQISFGIERAVYINGNLVTVTQLSLQDLGTLVATVVQSAVPMPAVLPDAGAAPVSANMPATSSVTASDTSAPLPPTTLPAATASAPTAVASPAATASAAAPATAPAAVATTGSTAGATTVPATMASNTSAPVVSSSGSIAIIQNGTGNVVLPGLPDANAIATIVQNSLNDQKIQSVTTITANVNSLEIIKSIDLQSIISNAVNSAVTR